MKFLPLIVVIVNFCVLNNEAKKFLYQNGHCEPFTIEFIASLITREARQLLSHKLPATKNVRFDLYTRRNPYERQLLNTGDELALFRSNFNPSWPVRISIHGFNGLTKTCSSAAIKDAYLAAGNFNIILFDWSDYALSVNYLRVINEVFEIGQKLNDFVRFLHRKMHVQYKDVYLIGHSFGCHIAGVAGKLLKPDRYGVIYALDTAGPIHTALNDKWRLAIDDALYVESIQTDIALFGFPSANFAHASFFPNWGLGQRHCPNVTKMVPEFLCDHFGSLYYFAESIRNRRAFGAVRCKNYQSIKDFKCGCGSKRCKAELYFGGEPAIPKRGVYYFSTRKTEPFGFGDVCRMKWPLESTNARL